MTAVRISASSAIAALLWATSVQAGGGAEPALPSPDQPNGTTATCVPTIAAGSQTVSVTVDETIREAIVHVPPGEPSVGWPAVIAFHGYTAFADQLEGTSGLSERADERGFVVAYPQGLGGVPEWHFAGNRGEDPRDLSFTQALIELLTAEACVDQERIVLAGHSMGGGMASDAACRLADQVAGVVLVAALWFELPCEPARAVPVVAMHALDDPVLPYSGGPIPGTGYSVPEQLAVETALAAWAAHDGCGTAVGTKATEEGATLVWPDCAAPVVLHRLTRGGHDWPRIASDLIVAMVTDP
jgi:polyhydroxybutyrate depolymerase